MKCQACEEGDHQNCGMQTWCECDCTGPEGVDFGFENEQPAQPFVRQSELAMTTLLAREIWRYNECPWDFDNPPDGMAQLQKQIAMDHAKGLLDVILGSALFKAKFASVTQDEHGNSK